MSCDVCRPPWTRTLQRASERARRRLARLRTSKTEDLVRTITTLHLTVAPRYPADVVFPGGVTTARIDDVDVDRRLPAPAASELADGTRVEAAASSLPVRPDVIRKHADRIGRAVKRIEC